MAAPCARFRTGERVYAAPAKARIVAVLLFAASIVATMNRRISSLLAQSMQAGRGIAGTQFGLLRGFAFAITFTASRVCLGRAAGRGNRRGDCGMCADVSGGPHGGSAGCLDLVAHS